MLPESGFIGFAQCLQVVIDPVEARRAQRSLRSRRLPGPSRGLRGCAQSLCEALEKTTHVKSPTPVQIASTMFPSRDLSNCCHV